MSESGKYLAEHHADDLAKLQKYVIYSQRAFYFFLFVVFVNVVLTYNLIMHPSKFPCTPNAKICAACAEASPAWTDLVESIWGKVSTAIFSVLVVFCAVDWYRRGGRL